MHVVHLDFGVGDSDDDYIFAVQKNARLGRCLGFQLWYENTTIKMLVVSG